RIAFAPFGPSTELLPQKDHRAADHVCAGGNGPKLSRLHDRSNRRNHGHAALTRRRDHASRHECWLTTTVTWVSARTGPSPEVFNCGRRISVGRYGPRKTVSINRRSSARKISLWPLRDSGKAAGAGSDCGPPWGAGGSRTGHR